MSVGATGPDPGATATGFAANQSARALSVAAFCVAVICVYCASAIASSVILSAARFAIASGLLFEASLALYASLPCCTWAGYL